MYELFSRLQTSTALCLLGANSFNVLLSNIFRLNFN
jgi:hypothetical protein